MPPSGRLRRSATLLVWPSMTGSSQACASHAARLRDASSFSRRRQAHELALKGPETDATKRALATFGNPFGLALYDRVLLDTIT